MKPLVLTQLATTWYTHHYTQLATTWCTHHYHPVSVALDSSSYEKRHYYNSDFEEGRSSGEGTDNVPTYIYKQHPAHRIYIIIIDDTIRFHAGTYF